MAEHTDEEGLLFGDGTVDHERMPRVHEIEGLEEPLSRGEKQRVLCGGIAVTVVRRLHVAVTVVRRLQTVVRRLHVATTCNR